MSEAEFTKTEQALIEYFNAGADLAEHLKRIIKKDQKIDHKTVVALNNFMIAGTKISDLQFELERRSLSLN